MRRSAAAPHLLPVLAYALFTIILTWPLVIRLGEVVPHDLGDPLLSIWTLWWNAHVMPFTERWWDGMAFFPSRYTLAFSDHRLGLGAIATPMMWLGASPLTAHNVVFLLTFFLSAAAAYALCFSLTRSRAAAFIGGLVFGFNPFRAGHLAHLELLASYWLPIVLLALHRWSSTLRPGWLVVLGVALLMQALTSGYYYFFSSVLVALWLIWFTPRGLAPRAYVRLAMALLLPLLILTPMLIEYRNAHAALGLSRGITEIEQLSADLSGLITAPALLALWKSPAAWDRPEGALMPGLTVVVVVVIALLLPRRERSGQVEPTWLRRVRVGLLTAAAVGALIAIVPSLVGPVAYEVLGTRIAIRDASKPLTIAILLCLCWLVTMRRVREAWASQSPLGFYGLATAVMWLLAMGPTVRLFGERVLYKAPYAWLMLLPGFRDEFRAPARFAMLAELTLSAAVALALVRLVRHRPQTHFAALCLVGAAVVAESWLEPLPLHMPPTPLDVPAAVPRDAAVLEWPLGVEDATAMYHSIAHGRRTVNGMSGYAPPHYHVLHEALAEGRVDALPALAAHGPVAIFVPRAAFSADVRAMVTAGGIATSLASTTTHEVLLVASTPGAPTNA